MELPVWSLLLGFLLQPGPGGKGEGSGPEDGMGPGQRPLGRKAGRKRATSGALTVEVPETCPQLVLVGALHALNFQYCCGWISPVCWPPPAVLSVRQKEAVNGLAKACVGCLGRGNALGGPAEAERILSSRTRDCMRETSSSAWARSTLVS